MTAEEFEQLKIACDRQGARCLSDFARKVMLSAPTLDLEGFAGKLLSLDGRVTGLEISMSRLVDALAGPKDESRRV